MACRASGGVPPEPEFFFVVGRGRMPEGELQEGLDKPRETL